VAGKLAMAAPAAKRSPSVAPTRFPRIAAGDLRCDQDASTQEIRQLLDLAREVKSRPQLYRQALAGQCAALLFEKPSLRTRLTFELAMQQLGGGAVTQFGPIAEREPVKDVARNLDRWVNVIITRTFEQQTVDDMAEWAAVPVVNALSDLYHPCQILADILTIEEHFGRLEGLSLAYVGDGNNVAHSLMLTATRLGVHFAIAHPAGYGPKPEIVVQARKLATRGTRIKLTQDAEEAVSGADAVYTDVWASMGQEHEAFERIQHFEPYRVDSSLMAHARKNSVLLHCLPAKRGQEITDDVLESRNSIVFEQARNRLHAQKALLLMLLGNH
jgi:ornithine carbamoyltransferase